MSYTKEDGLTPNDVYAIVRELKEPRNPILTTLSIKPKPTLLVD